MRTNYSVALGRIIKEFSLEILNIPKDADEIMISSAEINRPGLQMAGYFEFFDEKRIQILGKSELSFLERFTEEKATNRLRDFFSRRPPAVVICRDLEISDIYIEIAKDRYCVQVSLLLISPRLS